MSKFDRMVERRGMDHGRKRRVMKLARNARNAAVVATNEHIAKIEPIAPQGVAQPGARRKAS